MGALIDHLKSLAGDGASIEDVIAVAEVELAGGPRLAWRSWRIPAEAIAGAAVEAEELNLEVQGALQRFPASQSAGFHRTDLDPRAMAVIATMAYARRGGVYLPQGPRGYGGRGAGVGGVARTRVGAHPRAVDDPADVHRLH